MMHVAVEIEGVTPLLMHNIRLADKMDDFAQEIAKLTDKPSNKRTEAENLEIERLEFLGGLYFDPEVGYYLPTFNILRSWEVAAKITRLGTALMRAVAVTTDKAPLQHEGPKEPTALWEQPSFRFRKSVGVSGRTVTRMRPIFHRWGLEVEVELLETALDPDDLVRIVETAGRVAGLGDGRKLGYGRYAAVVKLERKK